MDPVVFAFVTGPYRFLASVLHAWRFALGFFAHAFNAFVSFCARVNDLALTTGFGAITGTRLPGPLKAELPDDADGPAPGLGVPLQASPSQGAFAVSSTRPLTRAS